MDEVSVYRRVLTAEQVSRHYNLATAEVYIDSDEDGLQDRQEVSLGTDPDNPDTDDDGLMDGYEVANGTDPVIMNSGVTYTESIKGSDVLAYWKLDEVMDTTVVDTVGGYDGEYKNGVMLNMSPALLDSSVSSVKFDGVDDYIDISGIKDEFRTETGEYDITVELWFKTSAKDGTWGNVIFAIDRSDGYGIFWLGTDSDGAIVLGRTRIYSHFRKEVGSGYNDGMWHHLVFSQDGISEETKLYVDGVLLSEFTETENSIISIDWRRVGKISLGQDAGSGDTGSGHYYGQLDEVSVYKRVLTDEQVGRHYDLAVTEVDTDD